MEPLDLQLARAVLAAKLQAAEAKKLAQPSKHRAEWFMPTGDYDLVRFVYCKLSDHPVYAHYIDPLRERYGVVASFDDQVATCGWTPEPDLERFALDEVWYGGATVEHDGKWSWVQEMDYPEAVDGAPAAELDLV